MLDVAMMTNVCCGPGSLSWRHHQNTNCMSGSHFLHVLLKKCVSSLNLTKVDVRHAQGLAALKVSVKYCLHCWKAGHIWNKLMYYFRYDLLY